MNTSHLGGTWLARALESEGVSTLPELTAQVSAAPAEDRLAIALESAELLAQHGITPAEFASAFAVESVPEPVVESAPVVEDSVTEAVVSTTGPLAKAIVAAALADVPAGDKIGAHVLESIAPQGHLTESQISAAVESAIGTASALGVGAPPAPTVPAGDGVTGDEWDKKLLSLEASMTPGRTQAPKYTSITQMYADMTGDFKVLANDGETIAKTVLEALADGRKLGLLTDATEAVDSTTFGQAFAAVLYRRLMAVYNSSVPMDYFNAVVSDVTPVPNFKTQRRIAVGGYDNLPVVAEGDPYTALTTPTDDESTYSVVKRGGTEKLTWESILADDLGALRRIPTELGLAAAWTLHEFIAKTLVIDNPTVFDGTALFHASHNNTAAATLDSANLNLARIAMRAQTRRADANSRRLRIQPRTLVVPPELEETAWELVNSRVRLPGSGDSSDIPNFTGSWLNNVVVLDEFADYGGDADEWQLLADPSIVPMVEFGYIGSQDPSIFLQDMERVGSMFDRDEITYKIRHVYGGVATDFRGFYRSVPTP